MLWKDVRTTDEAVGEDDVDGELNVEGPVSGVVEYEDSTEGSRREVGLLGDKGFKRGEMGREG